MAGDILYTLSDGGDGEHTHLVEPKPNFALMNLKMCSSDLSCSAACAGEKGSGRT